jgi:hypothetical protein
MGRGRPAQGETVAKRKYILEFEDSRWHFDLDIFPNGPYLVENLETTYDKLENYYKKWQKLEEPEYHENGRKKRITKDRVKKIESCKTLYWEEHCKFFPEDKPKAKSKRRKRNR